MQEIHLVGINHKTSKVSDRERFIVDDSNLVYLNDFLISKLDKKISGLDLDQKSTNIIISGVEPDITDIDFTSYTKLQLRVLSLNDHIKSLKLKSIEKLNLLSNGKQTSIIEKILFASACLSALRWRCNDTKSYKQTTRVN